MCKTTTGNLHLLRDVNKRNGSSSEVTERGSHGLRAVTVKNKLSAGALHCTFSSGRDVVKAAQH